MKKNKKYYLFKMNITWLNVLCILLLVLMLIITMLLTKIFNKTFVINDVEYFWLMVLLIPYFILHELLHGFSYIKHGADKDKVTFGAHLEKGVLCCLCKQLVSKKNILISLLYPFIFIGVLTYAIGIIFNLSVLTSLSICNISGCVGDLIMYLGFKRLGDFEYTEYDDPTGFALYSEDDLSNKKLFGLNYVGCSDIVKITKNKKIEISKTSIVFFILYTFFLVLYFFNVII